MTRPEDLEHEFPEADAAEQAAWADPDTADDAEVEVRVPAGVEAPDFDADDARVVRLDDDYR